MPKRISRKKKIKDIASLENMSTAFVASIGAHEYMSERDDDKGVVSSAVSGAAHATVASLVSPYVYVTGAAAVKAAEFAKEVFPEINDNVKKINRLGTSMPFASNHFVETRETFTMRQAAMAAIGQSRGNLENAMLGNESNYLR